MRPPCVRDRSRGVPSSKLAARLAHASFDDAAVHHEQCLRGDGRDRAIAARGRRIGKIECSIHFVKGTSQDRQVDASPR